MRHRLHDSFSPRRSRPDPEKGGDPAARACSGREGAPAVDLMLADFFEALMSFRVFSVRHGHYFSYLVKRTETGWSIWHLGLGGECDPRGEPYLYTNLERDRINYPAALGACLDRLWHRARRERMSDEQLQKALARLAAWVQQTERSAPWEYLVEEG